MKPDRYPSAGVPDFSSLLPVVLGPLPRRDEDQKKGTVPFSYMQRSESVDTPPLMAERAPAPSQGRPQEEADGKAAARSR